MPLNMPGLSIFICCPHYVAFPDRKLSCDQLVDSCGTEKPVSEPPKVMLANKVASGQCSQTDNFRTRHPTIQCAMMASSMQSARLISMAILMDAPLPRRIRA